MQPARPGQLETFWATVVEGDLLTSSNERKYLGFQLFTILLPHLRCACAQCHMPILPSVCFLPYGSCML